MTVLQVYHTLRRHLSHIFLHLRRLYQKIYLSCLYLVSQKHLYILELVLEQLETVVPRIFRRKRCSRICIYSACLCYSQFRIFQSSLGLKCMDMSCNLQECMALYNFCFHPILDRERSSCHCHRFPRCSDKHNSARLCSNFCLLGKDGYIRRLDSKPCHPYHILCHQCSKRYSRHTISYCLRSHIYRMFRLTSWCKKYN